MLHRIGDQIKQYPLQPPFIPQKHIRRRLCDAHGQLVSRILYLRAQHFLNILRQLIRRKRFLFNVDAPASELINIHDIVCQPQQVLSRYCYFCRTLPHPVRPVRFYFQYLRKVHYGAQRRPHIMAYLHKGVPLRRFGLVSLCFFHFAFLSACFNDF